MASKTRVGCRAITLQQPFAAGMVHGVNTFTRRGKATAFPEKGEWVAIHCGSNSSHLSNAKTMKAIRDAWPACPSDEELKAGQKTLLGFAKFTDGGVPMASDECQHDSFLASYPCEKSFAWKANGSQAVALKAPIAYPKGQLQVWHVTAEGFVTKEERQAFVSAIPGGEVKVEEAAEEKPAGKGGLKRPRVKVEEAEQAGKPTGESGKKRLR